ncbi:MAG: hypothetical protein QNJ64_19900 [Crocosphaera sp.]|nr:hypothetical protein [Crocosphaera sp.]
MKPTFKNATDWEKAELLMQPSFIRVMDNLRKQLEKSNLVATYEEVQNPFPGHQVILTHEEKSVTMSVWEICFKVCFLEYNFSSEDSTQDSLMVDIDSELFKEKGEIDWDKLEEKTQQTIKTIIENFLNN